MDQLVQYVQWPCTAAPACSTPAPSDSIQYLKCGLDVERSNMNVKEKSSRGQKGEQASEQKYEESNG